MKGQASLEALIVLLAFFLVLSVLVSLEIGQKKRAGRFMLEMEARAVAEKCALAVDSMSANPGAVLLEQGEKCYGKGLSLIYYSDGNIEASAGTIAERIETIQKDTGFIVRIENEPHYG